MRKRICCSSSVIENQYLIRIMPERTSMRSNSGTSLKNCSTCSSFANPMTRSTPARLYHERSNRTISPPAGKCGTYRWKYQEVVSRSEGAGKATVRQIRGFSLWVMRLITPPFPAEFAAFEHYDNLRLGMRNPVLQFDQFRLELQQLAQIHRTVHRGRMGLFVYAPQFHRQRRLGKFKFVVFIECVCQFGFQPFHSGSGSPGRSWISSPVWFNRR